MTRYLSVKDKTLEMRPDLCPYIHHFTRSRGKRTGYEILLEILKKGKLMGSTSGSGFIRGPKRAVCFMDIPYPALKWVLVEENVEKYQAYGVSITKSYAYRNGARPVVYLSPNERNTLGIPRDELWRVVRLEYDYGREDDEVTPIRRSDWTHEREWRSCGDFKLPSNCIVFVDKVMEVERLWRNIRKNADEFRVKPRAILPVSLILSCC